MRDPLPVDCLKGKELFIKFQAKLSTETKSKRFKLHVSTQLQNLVQIFISPLSLEFLVLMAQQANRAKWNNKQPTNLALKEVLPQYQDSEHPIFQFQVQERYATPKTKSQELKFESQHLLTYRISSYKLIYRCTITFAVEKIRKRSKNWCTRMEHVIIKSLRHVLMQSMLMKSSSRTWQTEMVIWLLHS